MLIIAYSINIPADISAVQSVPENSNDKEVAAMLAQLTVEDNERLILIVTRIKNDRLSSREFN